MAPSMKHRWPVCPRFRSAEPNGRPSHTTSRRALSWSRQPLASCDPSTPLSYHHGQGGCMEHLQFRLVRKKCHLSATLPPDRTQPQKLCTASFSSGTFKTLIIDYSGQKSKKFDDVLLRKRVFCVFTL